MTKRGNYYDWDRTYCIKADCKTKTCERHQCHIPPGYIQISLSNFENKPQYCKKAKGKH